MMLHHPLISPDEMRAWERRAFANGVAEEMLMHEAAAGVAQVIQQRHPEAGRLLVYAGPGHNGADALLAASLLLDRGWKIAVIHATELDHCKPLRRHVWDSLAGRCSIPDSFVDGPTVILDGLLGTGAVGEMKLHFQDLVLAINRARLAFHPDVISVDVPTGLDPNDGMVANGAVLADATVTFGLPKTGLVAHGAMAHVGRIFVVKLPSLPPFKGNMEGRDFVTSDAAVLETLRLGLGKRPFSFHKGEAGRVGLVAGSLGLMGAAHLASLGAQAAGAGLVTVWVPESLIILAMAAMPPEVMVRSWRELGPDRADAWGVGPGIGKGISEPLWQWMKKCPEPMVWDADAINWLAKLGATPKDFKFGRRLLTPHPGEFQRLWPDMANEPQGESARRLTDRWPVTLLSKSSRTVVAEAKQPLVYNTTGTPAMASGGMGDVLTGFLAGLVAQGLTLQDAAICGSWCLGRAGEVASGKNRSVRASEVAHALRSVII